jgi:hypothetical protein
MTHTPILFIGPVRAGKSTLARVVAAELKLPHVSLDELRWKYYREIGYDDELATQIRSQAGFLALMFYRQLFDPYSVERVFTDYPEAVIDVGAGVGPYENKQVLQHIQSLFAPIPNVFLLLPSQKLDESLRILKERDPSPPTDLKFDINAHFLQHPGYRLLAKQVIYTKDKTPDQSCDEVLGLIV